MFDAFIFLPSFVKAKQLPLNSAVCLYNEHQGTIQNSMNTDIKKTDTNSSKLFVMTQFPYRKESPLYIASTRCCIYKQNTQNSCDPSD